VGKVKIVMRVGLLSDTHILEEAEALPLGVIDAFRGVDLILHAGDVYIPSVLDDLARIAPVLAAGGDDDYGALFMDKRVKSKHVLLLEGQKLWLVHKRPYSYMFTSARLDNDAPDIIVFGHEHTAGVKRSGRILFVNPGSPTFPNHRRGLGTVGILIINSNQVDVQILEL